MKFPVCFRVWLEIPEFELPAGRRYFEVYIGGELILKFSVHVVRKSPVQVVDMRFKIDAGLEVAAYTYETFVVTYVQQVRALRPDFIQHVA